MTKIVNTPCTAPELEKVLLTISHAGGWDSASVKATDGKIEITYDEHKQNHENP